MSRNTASPSWSRGLAIYEATTDKSFAGYKPRVDLYVQTERGHVLVELKLCISSGSTLGRQLLSKVVSTLENLTSRGPASVKDVLVAVPRGASLERCNTYLIRGFNKRPHRRVTGCGYEHRCGCQV